MHWTFEHLCSEKLYTGKAKYVFVQTRVEYLGHIIGSGIVAVDPAKIHAIMDWPEPTYIKHIKQFLGLVNYYSHLVWQFSKIAASLYTLL